MWWVGHVCVLRGSYRLPSWEPRREGWLENVKCRVMEIARGSVINAVRNGSAGVGMCPPLKIVVFRGTEGTDR